MSIISIGIPLPDRSALPGQTGSGEEVNLQYATQNYCAGTGQFSPTVATPAGGTFSDNSPGSGDFQVNQSSGLFNLGVSNPGNYIVTYTVAGVGSANFPINIGAVINTTITGDSATCIGSAPSPADLTAVSGYSNYEWFKDNVSVQNGASNTYTPAFNVAGSFVYKVTITDNSLSTPCTATSSNFTFTVNALPTISISTPGGAEGFCAGSNIVITASPSSGTFAWYKDGTVISGATGYQYTASTAGEYKATVTDANGCTSALSNGIDLEQFASPSVTIATVPGTTICTGDTATLTANASGGTGSFTYSWSTGDTIQAISVTASGTYTVTVTDGNGCTATASQAITASTAATTIASINNDAAMSFNGVDQYVSVGSGLGNALGDGLANMTVSMWINITSGSINDGIFKIGIASPTLPPSVGKFSIRVVNDAQIQAYFGASSVSKSYNLGSSAGNWNHIAIVKQGTTISSYMNGTLTTPYTSSGSIPSTLDFSGEPAFIGVYWRTNGFLFDGKIDEVAVWNSALSSCDVKGIYEGSIGSNAGKAANLLDANTTIPAPLYWNRMGDS